MAVRLRRESAVRALGAVALLATLASTTLMARAAHLGGQIRHDEIRSAAAITPSGAAPPTRAGSDDH